MGKIKYSEDNKSKILDLISESRNEIIENTCREGKAWYANFCNKGNLFEEGGKICRLNGYYVDKDKKMKALSFGANKKNFISQDSRYFDFIPFAFSQTRESFFINNNFTINQLIKSNKFEPFENDNAFKSKLFFKVKDSSDYIDYDVEIITKDMEKEYYENLYLRKSAIDIFGNISETTSNIISSSCKLERFRGNVLGESVNSDGYINIQSIVVNSVINNINNASNNTTNNTTLNGTATSSSSSSGSSSGSVSHSSSSDSDNSGLSSDVTDGEWHYNGQADDGSYYRWVHGSDGYDRQYDDSGNLIGGGNAKDQQYLQNKYGEC